jgi:hypothetical protein
MNDQALTFSMPLEFHEFTLLSHGMFSCPTSRMGCQPFEPNRRKVVFICCRFTGSFDVTVIKSHLRAAFPEERNVVASTFLGRTQMRHGSCQLILGTDASVKCI